MVAIKITVEPRLLGKLENKFARGMRHRRLGRALQKAGRKVVWMLRAKSARVHDLGRYRSSWYSEYRPVCLRIGNDAPHFIYVERGRRPGARQPPIAPIRAWVLRHGMHAGAAFPVARAIARRGIRPRPLFLLDKTQRTIETMIYAEMNRYVDKVIMGAIK